ncbi:acyl-CoA dehydrogenase family protein [Saccharopolyspora spinosa]|uniref:acyl-CoA dehydrogenase family protein n=1 Tax=Saccharopolyspora spinosa TaxID=60894 RepID=UPI0002EEF2B2
MSVAHARTREQFGRPIGSFQAVKHMCADMLRAIEPARSAVYYAARAAADGSPEAPMLASLVKAPCADLYTDAASATAQIHGGLGYSWEHDAHLHFKRAKTSELLFSDPAQHRARLADLAGLCGALACPETGKRTWTGNREEDVTGNLEEELRRSASLDRRPPGRGDARGRRAPAARTPRRRT